jgi:hypothetical protein
MNTMALKRNNTFSRKGIATSIISVLLIIVAVGIVGYIVYKGISNTGSMLKEFSVKYNNPKINDSTAFLYSIDSFTISNAADIGCTDISTDDAKMFECPSGKNLEFSIDILNGGSMMRKFSSGMTSCKGECDRRNRCSFKNCGTDFTTKSSEYCYVTRGETLECDAGSNTFTSGRYILTPIAQCALEQSVGCYAAGMREPDRIYNPGKAIMVNII